MPINPAVSLGIHARSVCESGVKSRDRPCPAVGPFIAPSFGLHCVCPTPAHALDAHCTSNRHLARISTIRDFNYPAKAALRSELKSRMEGGLLDESSGG